MGGGCATGMPWTIRGATKDGVPPGQRKLYVYQRVGFTLEVYRGCIVVRERFPGTHATLNVPYSRLVSIRCLRGKLLLRVVGGVTIVYDLGPATDEVCALVTGLL